MRKVSLLELSYVLHYSPLRFEVDEKGVGRRIVYPQKLDLPIPSRGKISPRLSLAYISAILIGWIPG